MIEIPGFDSFEKLGEGGMATVWKARQISLDRVVAIKILSKSLAATPGDAARFQEEARAAAKLKHPGIVQVYDAQVHEGMYYFVMEYVAGYSVGDWIRRKEVLPESESLLAIECVADALAHAWDTQAIVHCDIKPDNIMIDSDGTIKVADLGLARSIGALSQAADEDEVMGTPNFMAPEQVRGDPDMDFGVDIYALGATLYHMLTGVMLFEDVDEMDVMEKQLSEAVDDPLDLNPKLSMSVCWLLEKMLAKDPEDRYENWGAVLDDISQVKRGTMLLGPVPEANLSTVDRSPRRTVPPRRRAAGRKGEKMPVILVGGAIVVVLAIIVLIGLSMVGKQKRLAAIREREKRQRESVTNPKVDKTAAARKIYRAALNALERGPDDYDAAIREFQRAAQRTGGTKYSQLAWQKVAELERSKQQAIDTVVQDLRAKADRLVAANEFDQAVDVYLNYRGKMDSETAATRRELAAVIRDKKKQHIEEKGADAERRTIKIRVALNKAAASVVEDGPHKAKRMLEKEIENDGDLAADDEELAPVLKLLRGACRLDGDILDSFRHQIGETLIVRMRGGKRTLAIKGVEMDKISAGEKVRKGSYSVEERVTFELSDLNPVEILQRLGPNDSPSGNLRKGCAAADAKAVTSAKRYFLNVPRPFGGLLVKVLEE